MELQGLFFRILPNEPRSLANQKVVEHLLLDPVPVVIPNPSQNSDEGLQQRNAHGFFEDNVETGAVTHDRLEASHVGIVQGGSHDGSKLGRPFIEQIGEIGVIGELGAVPPQYGLGNLLDPDNSPGPFGGELVVPGEVLDGLLVQTVIHEETLGTGEAGLGPLQLVEGSSLGLHGLPVGGTAHPARQLLDGTEMGECVGNMVEGSIRGLGGDGFEWIGSKMRRA